MKPLSSPLIRAQSAFAVQLGGISIAIALTLITFVRERQNERDVFFSQVEQVLIRASTRVNDTLFAVGSGPAGHSGMRQEPPLCQLAQTMNGRYPFVVALVEPPATQTSRPAVGEIPCKDSAIGIHHASDSALWIKPGGTLAAQVPPSLESLGTRVRRAVEQRSSLPEIATIDMPELGPDRHLLALIAPASAPASGAHGNLASALVDTTELMREAIHFTPGARQAKAIVTPWQANTAPAALVTVPPVWCLLTCTSYSAIRDITWGNARWRLHMSALAPPLTERYAGSMSVAALGLILSLFWVLHVRHAQSATWQVADMVERRESEMQSLNAILIEDIERRKRTLDELTRSRAQLRQLTEHNARVKEEERTRIAREIHDDLGQSMLVLRIDLSLLAEKETNASKRARIQQALSQIDQTVTAMRLIINELRPAVLDLGLDAAIEWESRKFTRRSGVPCALDLQLGERVLRDELTTAYYRIAQESLTNIMRHSQAKSTSIRLWIDQEWLFMKISDDGVGMQEDACPRSGSYGLIGIAERVFALDGAFHLDSAPNKGTQMLVAAPLIRTGGQAGANEPETRTLTVS